MSTSSSGWNKEIETILDNIRLNSITLEEYHKTNYFQYRKIVIYIKVPVIVISALNSIVSVSMQEFTTMLVDIKRKKKPFLNLSFAIFSPLSLAWSVN